MKAAECVREQDVLDALASDGPVQNWTPDLQAHTRTCGVCHDLVEVASALLYEHRAALDHAHPPSSGIVWWRAQMRARQEAARAATRPITIVQALAFASGAALFAMLLVVAGPAVAGWFAGLSGFTGFESFAALRLPQVNVPSLVPSSSVGFVLLGGLVLLLLGPVAVYFALGDE